MTPHQYRLIKCARCDALHWADSLKLVSVPDGIVHPYFEPNLADYLRMLDRGPHDQERERYLRRRAWWAGNDARRQEEKEPLSPEERQNLIDLLTLLEVTDDHGRLEKAEVMRELGEHEEALRLLTYPFAPNLESAAGFLRRLAVERDTVVRAFEKADAPMLAPPEENKGPHASAVSSWKTCVLSVAKAHAFAGLGFDALVVEGQRGIERVLRVGEPLLEGYVTWCVRSAMRTALDALTHADADGGQTDAAGARIVRTLLDARQALDDGDHSRAERGYQRALALVIRSAPSSRHGVLALGGLAEVYCRQGRWARALRELETALRHEAGGGDALLQLRLGQVYLELGRTEEAVEALARAREKHGAGLFLGEAPGWAELTRRSQPSS